MGSPFRIVLYTTEESAARSAWRAAFARIGALDAALTDYDPESELMRLCDKAGGPPVPVSADLFDVLEKSLALAGRSEGAFDPTVGPVVRLWRRARRNRQMPEADTLAKARALVGYRQVRLDPKARTVQLAKPGIKLDLGGIAKGYASQAAIDVLKKEGVSRALVAGAGDIVVSGPPPDAEGWTIGIAPLEGPNAKPSRYLLLHDCAISTSGDTQQYVELNGKRYSHIVDPKTGLGLTERSTVTVVAPDGGTADGVATAVSVLGPKRGLELVESTPGTAAMIVHLTEQGEETVTSKRWQALKEVGPKGG
jgi:thiamine biosynthesis lipoprotein